MTTLNDISIKSPPTIREEVYKYLREKILAGQVAPGDRLIETKLAEEINTSRTPVREALHKLEMERLIQSIPRVGYVVRAITEEEVEEICEIRLAVETLAVKWASAKITSKEVKRLEKIIVLTNNHIMKSETQAVVELDTEFHNIICKASRSQRIQEISHNLRDHMLRFRIKGLSVPEIASRSNEGHHRILNALRKGDVNDIESAVSFHLNSTKRDVKKVIGKRES